MLAWNRSLPTQNGHIKIDGHDTSDEKLHHDKSWKTKVEEETNGPGDA